MSLFFKSIILGCIISQGGFCLAQDKKDKYDYPNISSIYSSHPDRPFKYGYPYNRDEIFELFEKDFQNYDIRSGDVVGEVGAASGWLEGVFSVFSDSVTYYVQDIDSVFLNKTQLDAVVKHFSAQRTEPQSNSFHYVLGEYDKTNLPDTTFDLIIINNTFHEFTEVDAMMKDILKKLKPDGKVIIHEVFTNALKKVNHGGCEIPAYTVEKVEELLAPSGLYLTHMNQPKYSIENYLTFKADKEKADSFQSFLKESEPLFESLNQLNSKKTAKNYKKAGPIGKELRRNRGRIHKFYPSIELYLSSLAHRYKDEKQYKSAFQVGQILADMYKTGGNGDRFLGDLYTEYYSLLALEHYQRASKYNGSLDIKVNIILTCAALKKFDLAKKTFERAIAKNDSCAYIYHAYAYSLKERGRIEKSRNYYIDAQESYSKAIELEPLQPLYIYYAAQLEILMGDPSSAIDFINRAIYLNPFEASYYYLRSQAKYDLEDFDGYKQDKAKAKKLIKDIKKEKRKKKD